MEKWKNGKMKKMIFATNIIFIETYIIKGKGYNASCYYHTS